MSALSYEPAIYEGTNASLKSTISVDGSPKLGQRYRVPPKCGVAVRLNAGHMISIENTHGTQVCDFWAYLASDMNQFLSMSHCRISLQSVSPKIGDKLVTNLRQPIMQIMEDTSPGVHDTLMACCDLSRYQLLGSAGYHDNCADNLRMALVAIGVKPILVPDPFNIWMNVSTDLEGRTTFNPTVSSPGDRFEMLVLEKCIAVLSACPQDKTLINGRQASPCELHFTVKI